MISPVPHLEILPPAQLEVLRSIGPVARDLGFYLAGGTAVALHLGHRVSVDLDWFAAETPEPHELAGELREKLPRLAVEGIGPGAMDGSLDGVRLTFVRYRYPLLDALAAFDAFDMASMDDLVCMKLAAAAQRGEKKDFFDIVAICGSAEGLKRALGLYRRKFSLSGSGHVLMSLAFFDDAEDSPDPLSLTRMDWPEVKRRLVTWTRDLSTP